MDFTTDQQAHIDKLISKKYAEAMTKAEGKAAEQLSAAEAKHAEETLTLRAEVEKLQATQGGNTTRLRQALIKAEIAQLNAVNVTQVMKLINENIIIGEDGELEVMDDAGNAKFDDEGKPYRVTEFIKEFLDDNPHLVNARPSRGAGSMGNTSSFTGGGKVKKRAEFNKMDGVEKSDFIRSGGTLAD